MDKRRENGLNNQRLRLVAITERAVMDERRGVKVDKLACGHTRERTSADSIALKSRRCLYCPPQNGAKLDLPAPVVALLRDVAALASPNRFRFDGTTRTCVCGTRSKTSHRSVCVAMRAAALLNIGKDDV